MIDLQALGNRPIAILIGPAVSAKNMAATPEFAISISITARCPEPTRFGFVNLGPEALRGGIVKSHREIPPGAMQPDVTRVAAASIILQRKAL